MINIKDQDKAGNIELPPIKKLSYVNIFGHGSNRTLIKNNSNRSIERK